jgi:hypothetical protein
MTMVQWTQAQKGGIFSYHLFLSSFLIFEKSAHERREGKGEKKSLHGRKYRVGRGRGNHGMFVGESPHRGSTGGRGDIDGDGERERLLGSST